MNECIRQKKVKMSHFRVRSSSSKKKLQTDRQKAKKKEERRHQQHQQKEEWKRARAVPEQSRGGMINDLFAERASEREQKKLPVQTALFAPHNRKLCLCVFD